LVGPSLTSATLPADHVRSPSANAIRDQDVEQQRLLERAF
jgi:hypothetical protein